MSEDPDKDIITKRLQTLKEAKIKGAKYCAYQERTQQDVMSKLLKIGLNEEEANEVLSELILDNFVNEERYARMYAGGKFRMKKWGRKKIVHELKAKGLTEYCIKEGLKEIKEEEYIDCINQLIEKKDQSISSVNRYDRMAKITRFMISKGYEPDLVRQQLDQHLNNT